MKNLCEPITIMNYEHNKYAKNIGNYRVVVCRERNLKDPTTELTVTPPNKKVKHIVIKENMVVLLTQMKQ